ncbi:unnamed protein product [Rotaria sp. Silwood2]|nr:unnamed protein product [Rotaria sp. Silwood2]
MISEVAKPFVFTLIIFAITSAFARYLLLMKLFANLSNIVNIGSIELHPKVKSIDGADQMMLTHKLTTTQS